MKWLLILTLSLFGGVMGFTSVSGLTQGIEWLLWLLIALCCAYVLSRKLQTNLFSSALIVGGVASTLNGLIQAMFLDTYLSNNLQTAEAFGQIPGGFDPRLFVVVTSMFFGLLYGAVIWLFTLLARKLMEAREAPGS
jgi:hypothetical protein